MTLAVRFAAYGAGAFGALAATVRAAKGGDPFQLVTVVVPRGPVGLATRRRLAAAPGGVLNVRHVTLARLAADVAVPWLATTGKRPLTSALEDEAVRAVLSDCTAGMLSPARDHPATIRAMVRTFRELQAVSTRTLDVLSTQSRRAKEMVAVVRAVRARLADRYGDAELLAAAAGEVRRAPGEVASRTGSVVIHLPSHLGVVECALIEALAAAVDVTVLVGLTGDAGADGRARAMVELLGGVTPPGIGRLPGAGGGSPGAGGFGTGVAPPSPPSLATEVWTAPSADAEVLLAVRRLLSWHADGRPLERMALLHGGTAPYPRLLHDLLSGAGIPFNGAGIRPLSATVAGRTLLGYLDLVDGDWRRRDVMGWLAGAPVLDRGRAAPAAAWDRLSCDARIVGGLGEWRARLADHAATLRRRASWMTGRTAGSDDDGDGGPVSAPALRRDADACDDLRFFIDDLADRLTPAPVGWAGWGRWGRRLLDDLLGGPTRRAPWPMPEVAAFEAVSEVLSGLAALDGLGRRPSLADVRSTLQAQLEAPAPQTSRFGRGILCGRVADAVGLDLDVVWVLGMTDGAFPPSATDDVLIPDRERERVASEAELPRRGDRRAEGERDLRAALAGASVRVLSYPVGDHRRGGELRPARPLLDALGELVGGRRLFAKDLPLSGSLPPGAEGTLGGAAVTVPSFAAAVLGDGTPVSVADWDLRALTRWVVAGHALIAHPRATADGVLSTGLALRRSRRSAALTRFDGRIDQIDIPLLSWDTAQPVTSLERYARCPRQYLFATVLGLTIRERPEDLLRISPLDRGIAVHRILERYIANELHRTAEAGSCDEADALDVDDRNADAPDAADLEAAEGTLARTAAGVFAEIEAQRLTGRDALWDVDRAAILSGLRRFVHRDHAYRRERGAVPDAVEQRFDGDDGTAVTVELGGRRLLFEGRIDRIDRTAGGGLSVIDYKSGRPWDPDGRIEDPLAGGTRLQLAVYGLAARRRYRPVGPVTAAYWYVGRDGAIAWCEVSDELSSSLLSTLQVVTDSIEKGAFPARPGGPDHRNHGVNCATCPFDAMCPADRRREWERKRSDPVLADYVALVGEAAT